MPEIDIDIEVYCTCGRGLCNQTEATKTRTRQEPCFIVGPCEDCLADAYDKGYNEGRREAKEEE